MFDESWNAGHRGNDKADHVFGETVGITLVSMGAIGAQLIGEYRGFAYFEDSITRTIS